jgi:hypothetical protein
MGITYEVKMRAHLRTTGCGVRGCNGDQIIVAEVTGVEGAYSTGGVIVDPADFGLDEIFSFQMQQNVINPSDLNDEGTWTTDPWLPVANINVVKTDLNLDGVPEWRIIILLHPAGYDGEQGDGLMEVPDGWPMTFFPQTAPVGTIIGH